MKLEKFQKPRFAKEGTHEPCGPPLLSPEFRHVDFSHQSRAKGKTICLMWSSLCKTRFLELFETSLIKLSTIILCTRITQCLPPTIMSRTLGVVLLQCIGGSLFLRISLGLLVNKFSFIIFVMLCAVNTTGSQHFSVYFGSVRLSWKKFSSLE